MAKRISLKAGRGWRRVLLLFALSWMGLVAANAVFFGGGIKGAFVERRGYAELPLASEAAVAREVAYQRSNAGGACLPGTLWTTRGQEMKRGPIQLWEPPGEPPPAPYGGRPVPTNIVETECVTYERIAAHGFWAAAILLAIGLIAILGGWLARGFARDPA